jgi:flavodoxin
MKVLVVFYSHEGNTRFIAEQIADATSADVLELKPVKEMSATGFMKYVWGGKQVAMGEKPDLRPYDEDPRDYDLVFIGTPVWSFTYAPVIRTFLETWDLTGRKVALFACHSGVLGRTFKRMRQALAGVQVLAEMGFVEPLAGRTEEEGEWARTWALTIVSQAG